MTGHAHLGSIGGVAVGVADIQGRALVMQGSTVLTPEQARGIAAMFNRAAAIADRRNEAQPTPVEVEA